MNAFRLRRLPVNGLKTKQCEQGITGGAVGKKKFPFTLELLPTENAYVARVVVLLRFPTW